MCSTGFREQSTRQTALEAVLAAMDEPLSHAIYFDIPSAELLGRIERRADEAAAKGIPARSDDQPDVLKRRILEFETATAPLLSFYERAGLLRRVNAARPVDAVTADLTAIIAEVTSFGRTTSAWQRSRHLNNW